MGRGNALTAEEKDFIRATFPQLSVAKIAERLGRSRPAVNDFVKAEGLRDAVREAPPPEGGTRAERLARLRDLLAEKMADPETPPGSIAGLAREYRATLDEIDRLEGGPDDPAVTALAAVAAAVAAKMPS